MNPFYPATSERAQHRCEYCLAPEEIFNFPFQVEHIQLQAHNGTNEENNLALSRPSCNTFKSDFETGRDDETQTEVRLFHPRRDVWTQHFRLDKTSAEIIGLSPIGRATGVCE